MGVVWRAEDLTLRRSVALKFLTEASFAREDHRVRFLREAHLAAALNHPGICTIHEVGEVGEAPDGDGFLPAGTPFIAMEVVAGRSLSEHLRKHAPLPLDGSAPPIRVADWPEDFSYGLAWLPDGDIVALTEEPWRLVRFPTDGRAPPEPLPLHGTIWDSDVHLMNPLPGGRHLLALGLVQQEGASGFHLFSIDTRTGVTRQLIQNVGHAEWSPSGHILFSRRDALLAVPFDLDTLRMTGGPVIVSKGLQSPEIWGARFELSRTGTLAYIPGGATSDSRRMTVLDREGRSETWSDDRLDFYNEIFVTPDGSRMATSATHSGTRNMKVWISEMARPNLRLLVSIPGMDCHLPVLSDDGERVFYECEGDKGGIYMSRFDGTGAPALVLERGAPDIRVLPTSLTPDGSDLLFIGLKGRIVSGMVLRMATGGEGVPSISPLIPGREGVMGGRLSPDGKWVAVLCTKTGRLELYLQRFEGGAGVGRKIPVTTGSVDPVRWFWAKETTGNILEFLYTVEDILYSITIKAGLNPAVSEPRRILDLEEHRVRGLTSLPGRRFLVTQNTADEAPAQINFVLNFHEEIRRKFAELEQ